jgi:glycolate oxidase
VAQDRSSLLKELVRDLGQELVLLDEESLEKRSRDMAGFAKKPLAVVRPRGIEDVSRAVRFAARHRIPICPWGAGSSLTGAAVTEGLLLDMSSLNRVLKLDFVNWYAHVEAGVVLDELNRELEKHGFFFPPDPASSFVCTVGGAIAEGSGGMRCVKYGTMKDWVLALKVVLPNGEVAMLGEPLAKNRAGYDLVHLFVGSEGTLGVIVEAWLKIIPKPKARVVRLYALFEDWASAGRAIIEIRKRAQVPRMLEFMDRASLEALRLYGFDVEVAEAALLIDIEQYTARDVEEFVSLLRSYGSVKVELPEGPRAEELLLARMSAYLATAKMAPSHITEDVVVPIDRIVEYLAKARELEAKYRIRIVLHGHAGDGNIHPTIVYDEPSREAAFKALEELLEYAIEVGGSVTGEHGVGLQKAAHLRRQLERHGGSEALRLMKAIKRAFDPDGIMNPGKYVEAA